MKQPSELHDDFISSAGVPTIPLKTTKRRAYGELVPYVFVALCLIIIILVGHDVVYALFTNLMLLYVGNVIVASVLIAVLGVVINNKWMFLLGILSGAVGIGMLLVAQSFGVSIAIALMVSLLIYRWYSETYYFVSERWPLVLSVLALVFGLLLIVISLQILTSVIIAPVLLVGTGAILIWEVWRIIRR